jgi:hypothetical protein
VLAAEIQYFVLEGFVAVPAMAGEDAAVAKGLRALVNSNDGYVVWAIAKLSCAVHSTDRDPGKILVRCHSRFPPIHENLQRNDRYNDR